MELGVGLTEAMKNIISKGMQPDLSNHFASSNYITEKLYPLLQLYLQNKGWNSAELLQCFSELKEASMLPSISYLQMIASRVTLDSQNRLILRENGKIILPFEHFANAVMLKHMNGPHGLHLGIEGTIRAVMDSYTIGREQFGMEKEFIIEVIQSCPNPACRYYKNQMDMPHSKASFLPEMTSKSKGSGKGSNESKNSSGSSVSASLPHPVDLTAAFEMSMAAVTAQAQQQQQQQQLQQAVRQQQQQHQEHQRQQQQQHQEHQRQQQQQQQREHQQHQEHQRQQQQQHQREQQQQQREQQQQQREQQQQQQREQQQQHLLQLAQNHQDMKPQPIQQALHRQSSSSSVSTTSVSALNQHSKLSDFLKANLESLDSLSSSNKELLAAHNGSWTSNSIHDSHESKRQQSSMQNEAGQEKIVRAFAEIMKNMGRMKTCVRPAMCKPYGKQSEALQKTLIDTIQLVQSLRSCLPPPHIAVSSWKNEDKHRMDRKLNAANINAANINAANINAANINAANINAANLNAANLNAANLNAANLNSANLNSANLTAANLTAANLTAANLNLPANIEEFCEAVSRKADS